MADPGPPPPRFARGPVLTVAAALFALLLAVSGRYGYHRDELYFLRAGHHLAWGYPDQPPLTPLVARLMSAVNGHSLVLLRLPSAVVVAAVVVVAALTARELGGGRAAQILAAAATAISAVVLGMGHLLSTAPFDLLAWAVLVLLVVRTLRDGRERRWLAAGLVAGVGLLDSDLVAFLAGAAFLGVLASGPRPRLRSRWLWAGAAIALALWAPYLAWQASHGWPQLAESRAIAAGDSGTSAPRALFLPYQLALAGPWLAPVWIAGLVRLFGDAELRWCRSLGAAWVVLVVVFVASGGKPYYLAGLFPLLFAAGADPALSWVRRRPWRRAGLAAAFALSVPAVLVTLPVLPVSAAASLHLASVDYDLGEQVGWPQLVREIAAAYDEARSTGRVDIVASNYGEAGAVDRYGAALGLPHAFSGQTGYWYFGRPSAQTVLAVGFDEKTLRRRFTEVRLLGRLDNRLGLDNDEQHRPLWLCHGPRRPWPALWPEFRTT